MTERTARRPVAALTLSYVLAAVAVFRGFLDYGEERVAHLIVISVLYAATVGFGGIVRRTWSFGGHVVGLLQLGLMVWAFLVAPLSDTWALLVLPTCILVNQDYRRPVGWAWIVFNSVVMSAMIVYGHGWTWAPQFAGLYAAAYVLVGAYSISLKRAELANQRSERLVGELQSAHERLREYAEGVADLSAMRERNRLARDLHDSVTQTIFSMTLITQASLILHKRGSAELTGKLEDLDALAQGALREMRVLITELRDTEGTVTPLDERIRKLIAGFAGDGAPAIDVIIPDELPAVGSALGEEISSIVQEALNNVVKHARATRASVSAHVDRGHLVIRVEDDGAGFEVSAGKRPGHIGLASMSERATELNAQLSVTSAPGQGTAVQLTVPLPAGTTYSNVEESSDG